MSTCPRRHSPARSNAVWFGTAARQAVCNGKGKTARRATERQVIATTPSERASRLKDCVRSAGGMLGPRTDWPWVRRADGSTVAEIGDGPTVRLNFKGGPAVPNTAELAVRYGLFFDTEPGQRGDWPGGGFRVTDDNVDKACLMLAEVVRGGPVDARPRPASRQPAESPGPVDPLTA